MKTLKERLVDWQDFDIAQHALGVTLGVFEDTEDSFRENKGVFWSDDPLGEWLSAALYLMTEYGLLEHDEEECRFRWKGTP